MRPSNLYGRQAKKLDSLQNTTFSRAQKKYSNANHFYKKKRKECSILNAKIKPGKNAVHLSKSKIQMEEGPVC